MIENAQVEQQIIKDYKKAVITVAWCIYERERKLIFSLMEFYPNECQDLFVCSEQSVRVKLENKKNSALLYYRRVCLESQQALNLYHQCLNDEHKMDMPWEKLDKNGNQKKMCVMPMQQMPTWPYFSVSKHSDTELCPYLSEMWGTCRTSHLIPQDTDEFLTRLFAYDEPVKWLEKRLLWNLNEYPELIGSIHMVFPNPIFRYIEERMIPGDENKPDQVAIRFAMREKRNCNGICLFTIERSNFGLMNGAKYDVDCASINIPLSGKAQEFAMLVYSKEHGILEYSKFGSFIQSIRVGINLIDAIRKVEIPGGKDSYSVSVSKSEEIVIGEQDDDISEIDIGEKIGYRERQKKAEQAGRDLEQHLFKSGSEEAARKFIRNLVQQAKKRVILVDPYFATIDLYQYILSISSLNIKIDIITSALALKGKSDFEEYNNYEVPEKGEELLTQINNIESTITSKGIAVSVMTGKQPLIHDRFLIIDDQVWFSGNSLNHIGERASVILRLPDTKDIMRLVTDLLQSRNRLNTLEEWVKKRREEQERNKKEGDDDAV